MLHETDSTRKGRRSPALLVAIGWLALLFSVIAPAVAPADVEVVLETLKVDTAGGNYNRYSFTDSKGNGYGVYLNYANGKLTVERRDAWAATALATSTALPGGMALGQWYTLSLKRQGDELVAETYLTADPATVVTVTASDSTYNPFTQLGVNGGQTFDTDNIRVFANGVLVFTEDFDDNNISDWVTFRSGQIGLQGDGAGGYVLRKSGFNDPNGGILAPPRASALAILPPEIDAVLTTRKVDTTGGNLNRYSVTDGNGNGYGIYLNFNNSELSIERRDAWVGTNLATSADALNPEMDLFEWFTLALYRQGDQLTAEAYRGQVDPADAATPAPELTLTATDSNYNDFTSFGVHGGHDYHTDDVRVRVNGQLVLDDDFDNGNIEAWQDFESGEIDLETDGSGFVLRKSGFDDPNGGTVGLSPPAIDVTLATLKAASSGGNENRYSITDVDGYGYGFSLQYPSGKLVIERRDALAPTKLATSSGALPNGMDLNQWYTVSMRLKDGELAADAYVGRVDPATSTPAVTVTADDSRYRDFTQFNVNGGHPFLTDDILLRLDGELALDENFDDGNILDWGTIGAGQIGVEPDATGFTLLKSVNNDPDGGFVGLVAGLTLLTFDPAADGIGGIGDYPADYGVTFTGAELLQDPRYTQDGFGIENNEVVAAVDFDQPVSYIELHWVRLFEDIDFVATALDANGDTLFYFLSEACPLGDCTLSELSGTEIITGEGIVRLEFEGTPPGGSTLDRSDPIVGLDALGFAP